MLSFLEKMGTAVRQAVLAPFTIEIHFADEEDRHRLKVWHCHDELEKQGTIFTNPDTLKGSVMVTVPAGEEMEHNGIMLQLVGRSETRENPEYNLLEFDSFLSMNREISPPGVLKEGVHEVEFCLENVELPKESYYGSYAALRYFLRATVNRDFEDLTAEEEIIVQCKSRTFPLEADNKEIQMEVGVPDCMHIQFAYRHTHYITTGVLTGCIYFHIVRLNILQMEMSIIKMETVHPKDPLERPISQMTTIGRVEMMDGMPAKGEQVPVRWPLSGLRIAPSCQHNRFNVRYFLKLSLLDEKGRQFYKETEIYFHRGEVGPDNLSWYLENGNVRNWKDYKARHQPPPGAFSGLW